MERQTRGLDPEQPMDELGASVVAALSCCADSLKILSVPFAVVTVLTRTSPVAAVTFWVWWVCPAVAFAEPAVTATATATTPIAVATRRASMEGLFTDFPNSQRGCLDVGRQLSPCRCSVPARYPAGSLWGQ